VDEPWRVRDDSPFPRHEWSRPRSRVIAWIILVVVAGAVAGGYYYWMQHRPRAAPPPPPPPAVKPKPTPAPPPSPPAILHPLETPPPAPLPALDQSDSAMRDALEKLVGAQSFAELFYPDRIILRIVATVDSLPRRTAPAKMMPVKPVPSAFVTAGKGDETVIDARNSARYAPYVRIAQAIDAKMAVDVYVKLYPLFQKAYEQLGYPHGYFNDRLMDAIDDLLAAPEPKGPVKLVRPRVLYEYADPDLESRSAGQKIMIRMGSENAAIVKAKLREIRSALLAHAAKH
jgi:hypothetical protein